MPGDTGGCHSPFLPRAASVPQPDGVTLAHVGLGQESLANLCRGLRLYPDSGGDPKRGAKLSPTTRERERWGLT